MSDQKEILKFQNKRLIMHLSKHFLEILEDLQVDHGISDEKYQRIRKRILDRGNDTIREIDIYIDKA